jgi:hypothetical protein
MSDELLAFVDGAAKKHAFSHFQKSPASTPYSVSDEKK